MSLLYIINILNILIIYTFTLILFVLKKIFSKISKEAKISLHLEFNNKTNKKRKSGLSLFFIVSSDKSLEYLSNNSSI